MGSVMRIRILLGRGKSGIHRILHIPGGNIYMASALFKGRLPVFDNVHIYSSKRHELKLCLFDAF